MHNLKRRIMGSLMAVLMSSSTILGNCPAPIFATASNDATVETEVTADATAVNANPYGLASATEGNILHAWDWKFTDVTSNMKDIAESGYSNVQVSPCQTIRENVTTNASWWQFYQPTDFTFGNSLGSAEEFKAMCDEAEKYGVNVIVDIVSNHLAGSDSALDAKVADKWKSNTGKYFHNYGSDYKANDDNDRKRMVTGTIGMPDLNTEDAEVQSAITGYLGELMDMGADGFRFDAAKHIGTPSDSGDCQSNYWKVIAEYVKGKNPNALLYGEILNEIPVSIDYYTPYIKVTESQKGWDMKDLTHGSAVSQKLAFNYTRTTSDKNLITWVESHDTFCNAQQETGTPGTSNYMSNDQIILCWSTVASRANAQSLFYARPEGIKGEGSGAGRKVTVLGNLGINTKDSSWKDTRVAAVNNFKNAMAKEGESCSTNGNLAIVKRGNKGVVVTNFGSNSSDFSVDGLTGLKDGTYKDASGQNGQFTVSGGKVSGQVKGNTFVVLYDADATPVETEAPETIAPTETPVEGAAKVTVSKDSGTFEKSFDVDVKVEDAEYAYYSYDGADWAEIKDGKATVTVGEDAKEVGDEFALYVKAKGADGKTVDVTKKYTYTAQATATATEAPVTGLKVRVKKSDYDTAPHIYLYTESTPVSEPAGKWPGTLMTEEGDYYVYTNASETSSVLAIFNGGEGKWQDPDGGEQAKGYSVSGYVEYAKGTVSKVEGGSTDTSAPATVSPKAKKAGKAPEFVEPGNDATPTPVVETEAPTPAPATEAPTEVPATEAPTPVVEETPSISVDIADGSEFDTETMDVTVTVKNATNATYIMDDGSEKSFLNSTVVTLGQGKIADSEVTLKVTATDGKETVEQTYTYKKVFNPGKAAETQEVKVSAIVKVQSAMEIVKDAAEVNALSGEPESSYYATNPNKQAGSKKTIKSASDFTESDIIAQGLANDDPGIFRGSHEAPKYDPYAMYGAYDDKNVYIGIQYTNVIDVVDPAQQAPQTGRGKPNGADADIPQMLVFDTGSGNYTDGSTNSADQKTVWNTNVMFGGNTNVDKIYMYSPKDGITNQAIFGVADGKVDYNTVVKSGYQGTPLDGTAITWEDGFFGSHMYGIKDNGYSGYKPEDITDDNSKWVDFLTEGHSKEHDTFCILTIPMNLLGVSADQIEKDGIGVMAITTYGESGMGSLPMDMTMLDNACDPYGKDDSTSHEKDDEDLLTVSLAQLGGTVTGVTRTPRPITSSDPEVTETPAAETPAVETPAAETPAAETPAAETPAAETPAVETPAADATATPVVTEAPAATPVATEAPKATPITVETSDTDQMVVNFGADRSAPQMSGEELILEAKPMNTKGECQYQFAIDGVLAQGYSECTTYVWKADAGQHTIQVSVKDEENNTVVVEKEYFVEGEPLPTEKPTEAPATATPVVPTQTPAGIDNSQKVPDAATQSSITASLTVNPAKSAAVKTKVSLVPNVTGFKTSYTYSIIAKKTDGTVTQIVKDSNAASATWVPKSAGTYTLTLKVVDAEKNETSFVVPSYKITKLKLSTAKASKKTIKAGSKVKFTAKATSASGSVKYQFVVKKGSKKIATRKYNKKATYTWTAKKTLKAGTYKCVITAKDSSGVKVSKTVSVKVKAKAKAKKAKKAKK